MVLLIKEYGNVWIIDEMLLILRMWSFEFCAVEFLKFFCVILVKVSNFLKFLKVFCFMVRFLIVVVWFFIKLFYNFLIDDLLFLLFFIICLYLLEFLNDLLNLVFFFLKVLKIYCNIGVLVDIIVIDLNIGIMNELFLGKFFVVLLVVVNCLFILLRLIFIFLLLFLKFNNFFFLYLLVIFFEVNLEVKEL